MTELDLTGIDQLPSGNFRIRLQYRGQLISGTAPTAELAVQLREEMKRQIIDGELTPTKGSTAKTLGPRFLSSRSGNRDSYNDEIRWHKHIANCVWARLEPRKVTRADGNAWLAVLKQKQKPVDKSDRAPKRRSGRFVEYLSVSTRHHCLVLARRFFEWAMLQPHLGVTANPFSGLTIERQDGDEDEGYQDTWYLDLKDQNRLLATWLDDGLKFDECQRAERWLAAVAFGSGLREREQWCLHLDDVFVAVDEENPRMNIRFGSWDPIKKRFRPPKGRKGEKKVRTVHLHGVALEAMRTWLAFLPTYAQKNPGGLVFPTERGKLRLKPPRTWRNVGERFGVIPRIGRGIWWHLLRHTFGSSLISGWWGMRWMLPEISKEMGHTDIRTTQIYAHLAPEAQAETAARARSAYLGSCHGAVTAQRPAARSERIDWHARKDSNFRHPASKASSQAMPGSARSTGNKLAHARRRMRADAHTGSILTANAENKAFRAGARRWLMRRAA